MAYPTQRKLAPEQVVEMLTRFGNGESAYSVGKAFGVVGGTVHYHARMAEVRRSRPARPVYDCPVCGSPFTKQGYSRRKYCSHMCGIKGSRPAAFATRVPAIHITAKGYRIVRVPLGHVSRTGTRKRKGRLAEHILVAEAALGRTLKKGEQVHHIDGDRLNNQPSNLLVCTNRYHSELHARMAALYQAAHFRKGVA